MFERFWLNKFNGKLFLIKMINFFFCNQECFDEGDKLWVITKGSL